MPRNTTQKRHPRKQRPLKKQNKTQRKKTKVYYTHDNGAKPFEVTFSGDVVDIYTTSLPPYAEQPKHAEYTIHVKRYTNVKRLLVGKSVPGDDAYASFPGNKRKASRFGLGNSVLVDLGKKRYVFVGHTVQEFTTDEPIQEFHSMVGNNDVPYPLAVGKENVYFLLDNKYVSRKYFDGFPEKHSWALDAYSRFWGISQFKDEKNLKKHGVNIKGVKVIHKRNI